MTKQYKSLPEFLEATQERLFGEINQHTDSLMANRCYMPTYQYVQIRKGQYIPTGVLLDNIARAFQIDFDDLLKLTNRRVFESFKRR